MMSRKPVKKSDQSKSWMKPRRDSKILARPEYHLIVSEGTKTEPNYFYGLVNEINQNYGKGRIHIRIEGEGRNTLSLLERAEEHVKNSNNPISHVWLVYDKDDFPLDDFDNTAFKCEALNKINYDEFVTYHTLWSNQCVELWFLLHFALFQSDVHRNEYTPMLNKHLSNIKCGEYKKNREDIYAVLRPYIKTAIKNAKQLEKNHSNKTPSKNAPGTMVFKIFDLLSVYLNLKS
jgi:hypothetical protein